MIKYLYGKLLKKVTRGHHLSNKCSHVLWTRMLGTRNDKNRKRKAHLFHTKMRCSAEHKSLNTHAAIFYIVDNDIGFCLAHEGHVTFAPRLSWSVSNQKGWDWHWNYVEMTLTAHGRTQSKSQSWWDDPIPILPIYSKHQKDWYKYLRMAPQL